MSKLLKKQGGFTLLELLIVIVIIGILAVLIIPNLVSGPQRARDSQRKSDLRNLKTALETYYNDNNSYPASASWKTDLTTGGSTAYLKSQNWPQDPKTKTDYTYTPAPTACTPSGTPCASYTLNTTLENTKDTQATGTGGAYAVQSAN